ncbi:MAG: S8 family serine peptidase [Bacteroidota bacterium]
MWYPISFTAATAFLALWLYFSKNERKAYAFRNLFLLAFSSFVMTSLTQDASWSEKWTSLSQDLMLLGAAGGFYALVRNFRMLFWFFFLVGTAIGFTNKLKCVTNCMCPTIEEQTGAEPLGIALSDDYKLCNSCLPDVELLIEVENENIVEDLRRKYDLEITPAFVVDHPTLLSDWYSVDLYGKDLKNIKKVKRLLTEYAVVEENEYVQVAPIPSQKLPNINTKFGINDPGLSHLWGFESMQIDLLYNHLKKEKIKPVQKAKIAILDTGVDAQHEDLKANYVSTKRKYDQDVRGHGTHCAGIAAAVSNNGLGVASFAPTSDFIEITSIKVLNNFGMGTQQTIIQGMIEAADSGADVISMSLGAMSSDARQKAYNEAVQYCKEKGVIVIAAAGNSNANAKNYSPANAEGIITVSALQQNLQKAGFSNTVHDLKMGIAAPGKDIYSCVPDSKYQTFSGTSMATPYVAGLVGLMRSLNPDLTTEEVYAILDATGKTTKSGLATGKLIAPFGAVAAVTR